VKLLTQKEVNELPDGTRVLVRWSDGNGPWEYGIERAQGVTYAVNIQCERVGTLLDVGPRPATEVSLRVPS
jgi:hypothetical protein